jgi:hypothetical protein
MANTTFSGPVRSQGGFQEWDGSTWVPIGGGGGGGTALTVAPDATLNLEFTEIGQIITVVNDQSVPQTGSFYTLTLSCTLAVPANPVDWNGKYIGGSGPSYSIYALGGSASLVIPVGPMQLQFVLAGVRDLGYGGGLQAFVNFNGNVNGEINGP